MALAAKNGEAFLAGVDFAARAALWGVGPAAVQLGKIKKVWGNLS
jgi:hypothetical protein